MYTGIIALITTVASTGVAASIISELEIKNIS